MEQVQGAFERILLPVTNKINQSKTVTAITHAMVSMMPITLGGALFSILTNFPIMAVQNFLTLIGLKPIFDSFVTTSNLLTPIILAFAIAFNYAKNEKINPFPAGLLGLAVYFILMPEKIIMGDETITAFSGDYLGGNGIFVAMISSVIVAKIHTFVTKKNFVFKMPDEVPPMISQAFEPIYSGVAVIGLFLLIKYVLTFTPFETIFELITKFIQEPITQLGGSVFALILLCTFINLVWFFGIHPMAILSVYSPILIQIFASNIGAYQSGADLPYMYEQIVYIASGIGGTGNTIGLAIVMLIFAKSKQYKAMNKLVFIPSLFNINEPLIFGVPVMLNPFYLVPMLISPSLSMGVTFVLTKLIPVNFNPIANISLPGQTPTPIIAFMAGGLPLCLIILLVIALNMLLYLPFFKAADRAACAAELKEEIEEQNKAISDAVSTM